MAINLLSLLGQSIGVPVAETVDPNDIVVNSANQEVPAAPPAPPPMGNREFLEEAMQANQNAPQRQGMFGTKGTLRDILGIVGDAFLMQSGNKAIYNPVRQQEKMGDAMTGYTADPLAAIERLSQAGFGDQAAELHKQYTAGENARIVAAQAAEKERRIKMADGIKLYAQALSGMGKDNYDIETLNGIATEYGLPSGFMAPTEYDPKFASRMVAYGTPRTTQINESLGRDRLTETVRHNKASEANARISATRPRGGGRAPNPTDASIAAPIIAKMERDGYDSLTPQQKQVLQATGRDPTRRGVKRGSAFERMMGGGGGGSAAPKNTGSHPGFTVTRRN